MLPLSRLFALFFCAFICACVQYLIAHLLSPPHLFLFSFFASTTYFMPSTRDPLLQGIDRRVEEFTRIPKSHQEQVQVLRYDKGQRYTAHHDFL